MLYIGSVRLTVGNLSIADVLLYGPMHYYWSLLFLFENVNFFSRGNWGTALKNEECELKTRAVNTKSVAGRLSPRGAWETAALGMASGLVPFTALVPSSALLPFTAPVPFTAPSDTNEAFPCHPPH